MYVYSSILKYVIVEWKIHVGIIAVLCVTRIEKSIKTIKVSKFRHALRMYTENFAH